MFLNHDVTLDQLGGHLTSVNSVKRVHNIWGLPTIIFLS